MSRKFWRTCTLTALGCAYLFGLGTAEANTSPKGVSDISGAECFSDNSIVIVSDTKTPSSSPRLHMAVFTKNKCDYLPIPVAGWELKSARSSDLESICAVPNEPGYFYAAESGYWKGKGGRIFRLHVFQDEDGDYRAQVEGSFRPFPLPYPHADYSTPDHLQIEGMDAVAHPEKGDIILLGLRGDDEHAGTLVWGRCIDGKYIIKDSYSLDLRPYLLEGKGRSCSDLHLIPNHGKYDVMSVGTADPGDLGPFESTVFLIGSFDPDTMSFNPCTPKRIHTVEGLKIEALGKSPAIFSKSQMFFGTDDEIMGGIVRPLSSSNYPKANNSLK